MRRLLVGAAAAAPAVSAAMAVPGRTAAQEGGCGLIAAGAAAPRAFPALLALGADRDAVDAEAATGV